MPAGEQKPGADLTEAQLFAYSAETLKYEIDMFFGMARILSAPHLIGAPSPLEGQRLQNAMLESFVIHLRNLIDFMYTPPKKQDIVAAHFCPDWNTVRPRMSKSLRTAKERANRLLAHLTKYRVAGTPWSVRALAEEVKALLILFRKHTIAALLSPFAAQAIPDGGSTQ